METEMTLVAWSIHALAHDHAGTTTCGGANDVGLENFREGCLASNLDSTWDASGLFHAFYDASGVEGRSHANRAGAGTGCLNDHNTGATTKYAVHAAQGKDWSSFGSYSPDQTSRLGKAIGHGLSHDAGEPDPPSDGSTCNKNAMYLSNGIPCTGTWRTPGTIPRIESYAPPKLRIH